MRASFFLWVTACLTLWATACQTSLNADELIAATLSGRAGEISTGLIADLPPGDKLAIAQYLAAVESVSREMREVVGEGGVLRTSTRQSGSEIAGSYRDVGLRARQLSTRLTALTPPAQLAAAHAGLLVSYAAYADVLATYADAFPRLDFAELRRVASSYDSIVAGLSVAYDRLESDSNTLFRPGKRPSLPRPIS